MNEPRLPPPTYPRGTVRGLLATDHVSPATRAALEARLAPDDRDEPPRFLTLTEVTTLRAAADRLLPPDGREQPVDLAAAVDRRLASGAGDGWRYDALPPDGEAYRLALRGLDECAGARFSRPFASLAAVQRDDVLAAVQCGEAEGKVWQTMQGPRFFEDLLAELVQHDYADPLAQEQIGYVGMADLPAWTAIGLNEREAREPRPLPGSS